ncbi:hypothetical protein Ping_0940 [Psychromonas ingrahamii 37]|uniref:Uncharacterized protein n=1 Tax=Psychromonas ingrahamii (strain DSM 17664 / CCUG 51855 / 37) TaxID=357804 RepID=A1STG7_PSYIN|nr:hypothetical protein [Psychromonas ingrahamii]ABM02782.1 hypothetical protein Ping_0940 [Psychromonas ingrahamii 37]
MLTKSKIIQLLFMLIVLVSLFIWRTINIKTEQQMNIDLTSTERSSGQLECDYLVPCELLSSQGRFWLSVDNPTIKAEQWINFRLESDEQEWRVIDAKIVGKEMFMGRIPVTFVKTDKGFFSAKTLVGACTTPAMIWQLKINILVNGIKDQLLFDFMVKK